MFAQLLYTAPRHRVYFISSYQQSDNQTPRTWAGSLPEMKRRGVTSFGYTVKGWSGAPGSALVQAKGYKAANASKPPANTRTSL
jgi:hypothetical protein